MMRVTTLYAASSAATAHYYTQYLADAPGEQPGRWLGHQAPGLGLTGDVSPADLEALLSGLDPTTRQPLGHLLTDRITRNGTVVRAVAGFDATLSAPKSLSVWWALTGDEGLAECHDVAVAAVADSLERFGATTRVRSNRGRLHLDSQGLTMAAFRQTTSRLDDPQLHTHLVISAKVQTADGRWLALDARVLKQHQRAFGGLYQSVLRAELTHRYGVAFADILHGQAEIAGVPSELIDVFSKRARQVDAALAAKVADFRHREGRTPSRFERAALEREASADTRRHKTGQTHTDLRSRWLAEAAAIGVTPESLTSSAQQAARDDTARHPQPTVASVLDALSQTRSSWHRLDVLRAITDEARPQAGVSGVRWVGTLDRAVDRVLDACVSVDPPPTGGARRASDGRSVWLEPVGAHVTSPLVLAQEEAILAWAIDAQLGDPRPSATVLCRGLDVVQAEAAAAIAGGDRLVLVVGPAGTGKTTMLRAATRDLTTHGRRVRGVAPSARAAQVLAQESGMLSDTVAKLIHEQARPDGPSPAWKLHAGTTVVIDEAGMLATPDLHRLVELATAHQWRLALVGDPRQLQAVGRGGLFGELCTTARTITLEHVHRFVHPWEADASLRLRNGDTRVLDTYDAHHRIVAGLLDDHLDWITQAWLAHHDAGTGLAITTTTNEHVTLVNHAIQQERLYAGQLAPADGAVYVADGEVYVGDHITTRRNDRTLHTTAGDTVRNRDRWTVTHVGADGSIVAHGDGRDAVVTLPADYVRQHVQLGYATTEPGNQGDTQTASITLATAATTARGLYVGMTRRRESNHVLVVTDGTDLGEARDTLERILTTDRADTPAVAQRRQLAAADRQPTRATPRCEIPEWFAGHRAATYQRYREARERLEVARGREREVMPALVAARSALEAARQACAPHEEKIADAQGELHDARVDLRMTEAALTATGRRGRRAAKAAVQVVAERISGAEVVLADAERVAAEPRVARGRAEVQYAAARHQVESLGIGDLSVRLADLASQATALDMWCAWAQGSAVEPTLVTGAVERLVRGGPADRALAATAALEVRRLDPARRTASIDRDAGVEL